MGIICFLYVVCFIIEQLYCVDDQPGHLAPPTLPAQLLKPRHRLPVSNREPPLWRQSSVWKWSTRRGEGRATSTSFVRPDLPFTLSSVLLSPVIDGKRGRRACCERCFSVIPSAHLGRCGAFGPSTALSSWRQKSRVTKIRSLKSAALTCMRFPLFLRCVCL